MKSGEAEESINEEQAAIFAAFSDPTRLKLVKILAGEETPGALCVNALANLLGVSQSAVSQHMRILKNIGLVSGERQGYRIHYIINSQALKRCRDMMSIALTEPEPH